MGAFHKPVLLQETIESLNLQKNQNTIDCTVGGGGHALEILKKTSPNGKLLAIDLDPEAIKEAKKSLKKYLPRITLVENNYKKINKIKINVFNTIQVHAVLCDLGLSSSQLQDESRGFSFKSSGAFDLRFNQKLSGLTAEKIVNTYNKKDLIKIFREFGEEKLASIIAQKVIAVRCSRKIQTPKELADIIEEIYRRKFKSRSKIHPATKVFQALRIEVNRELESLKVFLPRALGVLKEKGRLAVISFHSLEERIIKEFIKRESRDCVCPPKAPACVCDHAATLKRVTKKSILPSEQEIRDNPRSRSAKLWVVEKLNNIN